MTHEYPDNADGDALRKVALCGNDMSREMPIDFHVAARDEFSAHRLAREAAKLGYSTHVSFDDAKLDIDHQNAECLWTCTCTLIMVPRYSALLECQSKLDEIAQPFGAFIDGWGTFGNKGLPNKAIQPTRKSNAD